MHGVSTFDNCAPAKRCNRRRFGWGRGETAGGCPHFSTIFSGVSVVFVGLGQRRTLHKCKLATAVGFTVVADEHAVDGRNGTVGMVGGCLLSNVEWTKVEWDEVPFGVRVR